MKFMNQNRFYSRMYREEGGADGGDGGGGTSIDPAEITKMQEALVAAQSSIAKLEENNKALLKEKADAKTAAQTAQEEAAKKSGDVEALEKSWGDKLAAEVKAREDKLSTYEQAISKMTSGAAATTMAAELAVPGSAEALMPHIASRLTTELTDGKPIIRVLDKDGKPSAMSLDDLKKEISENKAFAPLLLGSNASGDGKPGGKGNPGAKTIKRDVWSAMSPDEKSAFSKDGGKVED